MRKLSFLVVLVLLTAIAYGQPQKGGVIGVYALTVNLEPDVTMNQFLDFQINEFNPAFEKHFAGVKVFYLHEYRGEQGNEYGLMVYCESVEVYDKYWDEKGSWTALLTQMFEEHMRELADKGSKLGEMSWDFTDWKIL
jgi:hypothetical protein